MDKKRIKPEKGDVQNNERRKAAQMFVLPPDLLEKLGINLGQFTSPAPHPGTSRAPEASKEKYKDAITAISNSTVNNGDLTTKSKCKATHTFVPTGIPSADDNINKSEEFNDPSVLKKLLRSETVFADDSFKRVSAEGESSNTYNSMLTSEASQANNCSSILETASLMKKSVLLSPTFCNTDFNPNTCDQSSEYKESSVVPVTLICTKKVNNASETLVNTDAQSPSYVEIWTANVNEEPKGDNNDLDRNVTSLHESSTAIGSSHWQTRLPETFAALSGPSQNTNNVNTINTRDNNTKTYEMVEEFAVHESNNNNNFIRSTVSGDCDDSQNSVISTVANNLDEIYSSDASNQETKSKIKIISEQVLNPVQLKQIQNACASHKTHLMPVSVETLVRKTPEPGKHTDRLMYAESKRTESRSDFNELNNKDELNNVKTARNLTDTAGKTLSFPDGNGNKVKLIATPNNLICDSKLSIKSKIDTRKTSSKKRNSLNESIPDLSLSCIDKADHSSNNKNTVDEEKEKGITTYLESNDLKATRNLTKASGNTATNDLVCDSKQFIKSKSDTRKISSNKKRKSLNESIPDLNSSCIDQADHSSNNKTTVNEEKEKGITTYLESNDSKATRNLTKASGNTATNDLVWDPKESIKSKTETIKTTSKKRKSLNESIPDLNSSKADHCSNNKNTVDEEKVREIATYLVQLLNDRNTQQKKLDSVKKNYKCYKRHPLKAKLVSQGVEKPGGKHEIKRDSVNETKLQLQESLNCSNMDSWISTDDIICIGTTSDTHELTQKLCVCVDFGKLDYYNWDDYYEDIHFLYHKKDVCEPEICYSIYNDGEVIQHHEDNIQILDTSRVSATDVFINNSKSIDESKVIYEDASSSNNSVNTLPTKNPGKRGRPKKITKKDNIEKLDDSNIIFNKSDSAEKSAFICEDASSTLSINTSVSEQPAKRGRGRPKKISTQTKTDSTIYDGKSSSKDQHYTDNPSRRVSSISSSDEPLILKRAKRSSINAQHVKNDQTDNVQSECEVSYDVCIENTPINSNDLKCAICAEEVTNKNWFEHIKIHNYLAWRNSEPALNLDNEYEVIRHLTSISKEQGALICSKCQKQYKTPKSYYGHIQSCDGRASKMNTSKASDLNNTQESLADADKTSHRPKRTTLDEIVECGVCKETVKNADWIEHIRVNHNYMAKRAGEIALDENNEEEVKEHLYNICKYHDGLICNKCGQKRKYLKKYLSHLMACNGLEEVKEPENVKIDIDCNETVKCGVCQIDVYRSLWIDHIQRVHKYLAWIEGEPPLDVDNQNEVYDHLQNIVKSVGFLRCWVCSETRKIVKIFLQHVNLCELSGFEKLEPVEKNPNVGEDQFECGVCHEIGFKKNWKKHAMLKHYNIAWMVGQTPINLRNPYAVEKYLKEYKFNNKNTLVCKVCGETRVSCFGFYAHVMICGKSEAELEEFQNLCEICNKKYVCIYRSQHMASHRDSEMRKERREREAANQIEADRQKELEEVFEPGKKRKAAEKASKVIQDLKQEDDEGPSAKRSRCDSEDSVKLEETIEGESSDDDVDIDSDVSNEALLDDEPKRDRIRNKPQITSKISRLPFKVHHFSTYVKTSYKDFCAFHFTDDCLFNDWRHADLQMVSESVSKYLPTVTESCRIKYGDNKWTNYKRFEAAKISRGFVLYTGGCIQCLSWAPQPTNINEDFYFAVSTHRGPDRPRFDKESTPVHPGLIQIWSLTDFGVLPEFSLGLAHDYGTIWGMDWCPSGARDVLPDIEGNFTKYRLGLLAIACSNGFAYVLSVPYPDVNQSEVTICKAIPVVELRLNMDPNKAIYQATSVTWSTQKGHSVIVVGYADGTTALYDLRTTSPLLTKKENNITILYPFQDKRTGNGPVSGVAVTPSMESSRAVGGVCAGGSGGAAAWTARRGATQRTMLSAVGVSSAPHWPSYLLNAEVAVSSKVVNELEWAGGGRRAGGAYARGVCGRCASAVLSAPPLLRLVRAHPCYPEPRRPMTLATLRMVPLNEKPQIKNNDLSMVIEPLTYEDTVSKYGLELKMTLKSKNPLKLPNDLEQRPERFPLSDVTAISFCPSDRYHNRVAIGSHCGLVFILNAESNGKQCS